MSEAVKTAEAGGAPNPSATGDELKNLKAEVHRKIDNLSTVVKQQTEEFSRILSSLKPQEAAKAATNDSDLSETFYKDPVAYAEKVAAMTESRIQKQIATREQDTAQKQAVINKLYADYPELAVNDHDLTKQSIERFNEMSKELGNSPAVYKAAVAEVANELGLKPKSKRPASDDDDAYSIRGSGSSNRPARKRSDELDSGTKTLAELMGVEPEAVKKRQQGRKNFTKWE